MSLHQEILLHLSTMSQHLQDRDKVLFLNSKNVLLVR